MKFLFFQRTEQNRKELSRSFYFMVIQGVGNGVASLNEIQMIFGFQFTEA